MPERKLKKIHPKKAKIAQYFLGSEKEGSEEILETLRAISILTLALLVVIILLLVFTIIKSL